MECCVRRSASRYQKNGIGFGSRGRSLWPEANVTSPEKELLPVRYVSALLVRSCLVCQNAKTPNQERVPIQEFKMGGIGPGDLVAMDIGTLSWADQKFRYFVFIIDVFTRYMELIPL